MLGEGVAGARGSGRWAREGLVARGGRRAGRGGLEVQKKRRRVAAL